MKPLIKFAIVATAVILPTLNQSSVRALEGEIKKEDFVNSFAVSAQAYCETRYAGKGKLDGYRVAVDTFFEDLKSRSEYPDSLVDVIIESQSESVGIVLQHFIEQTCPEYH